MFLALIKGKQICYNYLTCKKYIDSTDNALELDYWYKCKKYEYKPGIEQWAMNIYYSIKF